MQLIGRQGAHCQPRTDLLQQSRQQEYKRLQQRYRRFQFQAFNKLQGWLERNQITIGDAAGFSLQLQSGLSQPLAESQRRQRRQIVKAVDAPAIEYLQNFWRRLQDFYRQSAQAFSFSAGFDNRNSGKSARGM